MRGDEKAPARGGRGCELAWELRLPRLPYRFPILRNIPTTAPANPTPRAGTPHGFGMSPSLTLPSGFDTSGQPARRLARVFVGGAFGVDQRGLARCGPAAQARAAPRAGVVTDDGVGRARPHDPPFRLVAHGSLTAHH